MNGKYPVIFLTLKSAKTGNEKSAFEAIRNTLAREFDRHGGILKSDALSSEDASYFIKYRDRKLEPEHYTDSLKFLCECIKKATGKNTVILIDEYDVPLESSFYDGYYDHMVSFIRSLFERALKTNTDLEFAVITGCLRISKESIFTGLNNLSIISILTPDFGEYFGFTDEEVRSWYDGYIFGNSNVYNPWSVIMYLRDHIGANRDYFPMSYRANTSSNSIVRDLIERADSETKAEIEKLMAWGGALRNQYTKISPTGRFIRSRTIFGISCSLPDILKSLPSGLRMIRFMQPWWYLTVRHGIFIQKRS